MLIIPKALGLFAVRQAACTIGRSQDVFHRGPRNQSCFISPGVNATMVQHQALRTLLSATWAVSALSVALAAAGRVDLDSSMVRETILALSRSSDVATSTWSDATWSITIDWRAGSVTRRNLVDSVASSLGTFVFAHSAVGAVNGSDLVWLPGDECAWKTAFRTSFRWHCAPEHARAVPYLAAVQMTGCRYSATLWTDRACGRPEPTEEPMEDPRLARARTERCLDLMIRLPAHLFRKMPVSLWTPLRVLSEPLSAVQLLWRWTPFFLTWDMRDEVWEPKDLQLLDQCVPGDGGSPSAWPLWGPDHVLLTCLCLVECVGAVMYSSSALVATLLCVDWYVLRRACLQGSVPFAGVSALLSRLCRLDARAEEGLWARWCHNARRHEVGGTTKLPSALVDSVLTAYCGTEPLLVGRAGAVIGRPWLGVLRVVYIARLYLLFALSVYGVGCLMTLAISLVDVALAVAGALAGLSALWLCATLMLLGFGRACISK